LGLTLLGGGIALTFLCLLQITRHMRIVLAGRILWGADFSKVRPVKVVDKIAPRPILFIHGANDHVVPCYETVELHRVAGNPDNPLWIIPGSGHVRSYARQPTEYVARVSEFFRRYIA